MSAYFAKRVATAREARSERHRRLVWRSMIVVLALSACTMLAASPASATPPTTTTFSFTNPGVIDCGTFVDNFVDFFDVRETDFFDAAGNPIRIVYNVEHHSNDVNSVTGLTLHEHGHYTITVDLVSGTETDTGHFEIANRPGFGAVVTDVGRVVFDANGNLLFFAGALRASQLFQGEQIFCIALA
jgi:hypothetical protein